MSLLPSTLSCISRKKYDVFLSFRGEDTRKNFTDHLYDALNRSGIITFKDDSKMDAGEEIAPQLFRAIQQSWCSVIVFSGTYAFSSWCLEELAEIVKQKNEKGHKVFPIFYDVNPSDLRKQKEKVEEAFAKLAERYKEDKEKILRWRNALTQVANIKGWHLNNRISNKMLNLNVNAVSKMKKLRLLKVLCLSNCDELKYLPNELRLLDWMGYPLRFLPPSFQPDNLVALLLPYSRIEQLWRGNHPLYKLKVLNLKGSKNLIETPDFTIAPNLEILILEGCTRIVDVHPSVGVLSRLKLLNLRSCTSLRNLPTRIGIESLETLILKDCRNLISLPSSIGGCKCLKTLDLSGCYEVENLPENLQQVELLEELDLSGTAIAKPPSFIFQLKNLRVLSLNRLKTPSSKLAPNLPSLFQVFQRGRIESVPLMLHSLSGLISLRELKLRSCNLREGDIPSDIYCLHYLEKLELGGNNFIRVPVSGVRFPSLQYLGLSNCRELKSFPSLGASRELFAAPSKVCNAVDWTRFNELHCYRLVENINAITMLKFYLKQVAYLKKSFDGVIPGGEIPKWFSHQTVGSSIKIPLPNNIQNDSQWIGVAFCCIFVNDDASRDEELTCDAVIHHMNSGQADSDGSGFRGRNPRRVSGDGWIFSKEYNQPIIKDHLYCCFLFRERLYPFSLEDKCGESETENSSTLDCSNQEFDELQFSVTSDDSHISVKVKKCGLRIVYQKDLEDINEDSAADGSIAEGPLIKRRHNVYEETEAEPQPKRIHKFFNL
ncbi:disease resistance protein RUN1-like [Hibiscus syriacus]|uniref:disease resistance protein RUN1-like n=1 Tax=Hibiscus syriacus TaxID=106335 RepID=UPI0019240AC6|nr:disease resistance protein RUN1-like [Hibiscus syriacus]